ncbi:hypothetical protein [Botrimarina hoheduenensis]|nr:hypothetical protein [Botrimarina hoheduenensis]
MMLAATPLAEAQERRAPRVFAPGVETVLAAAVDPDSTASVHDLVEVLADKTLEWEPRVLSPSETLHNQAKEVRFRRDVWRLEFAFKPLRMIRLLPANGGEQKLVWYLVYRVKNTGMALHPTESAETGEFLAEPTDSGPVRFLPHLVLEGNDLAPNGGKIYRAYLDKVMPGAVEAIRAREVPGRRLYSSVQMPLEPLAVGEERWGVATWSDLDPEIDFFSIFVRGLTNAYDWTDPAGLYQSGDAPGKGREFVSQTLQLNFWRPGDRFLQHENEVRLGVPPGKASLYGVDEGVAYRWLYR